MKDLTKKLQLGQGNTPLIRLYNLEAKLEWQGKLFAKCEYQNPTGSFKDRGSIEEISEAMRQKKQGVVCASTGNMAASLASFASRAELTCIVVIPQATPILKLQQAIVAGAKLVQVKENYDACVARAEIIAKEKNFLLCGDYKIRRKGQSTIGEELAKADIQCDGFLCPVGNGTVGVAISEGFAKYGKFPKFIGIQGKGADPLTKAYEKKFSPIILLKNPKTLASAMNVGNPLDGELTLFWVRKTNGMMMSVTDREILRGQKLLAETEGIYVEPSAATTVAGIGRIANKKQNFVLILTGSGLKTPLSIFEKTTKNAKQEVIHQSLPFLAV